MLKRSLSALLATVLLVSVLSSCADRPAQEADAAYCSFTDAAGREVVLAQKPERVAVLFSSFADVWVCAGGEIAVTVGEAVERGFAGADAVLVDAGAGKAIDAETLIAAKPDLVIASADIAAQAETAALLDEVGIPCALLRVETFDDYLRALRICTDLTGDAEAYQTYGEAVAEDVRALLAKVPQDAPQKRILFIRSGSGASSAKAKTAEQHFAAAMLEELGVYNIADNAPVLLDGLSIEEIITEDPDDIFIATMGDEAAARAYMDSVLSGELWQALSAVREGRVHYLPKAYFQFKPNASWAEAYRYLAELLYPEIEF